MMNLLETCQSKVLLCDGAMGTQLQQAGLKPGKCGEAWSLERPEDLLAIQKRYVDAGVDCLITCTFGASSIALDKHGLRQQTIAINKEAARVARRAMGDRGFVLGDIGPTGEMLEPFGDLSLEQACEAFREQAGALIEGGVDGIIIETMMSIEELVAALQAVRDLDKSIPLIASMAYEKLTGGGYATMMGVTPQSHAEQAIEAGADIIASNCGASLTVADHGAIMKAFRQACDKPLMSQPNAGKPELRAGQVYYPETPDSMALQIPDLMAEGARIVGGCCGTSPEHIAAFRKKLDAMAE